MHLQTENDPLPAASSPEPPKGHNEDTLASLRRELNSLKERLALLDLRPCSQCGTFFQRSDPKALLNCGEFICYRCVVNWWTSKRKFLDTNERRKTRRQTCPVACSSTRSQDRS